MPGQTDGSGVATVVTYRAHTGMVALLIHHQMVGHGVVCCLSGWLAGCLLSWSGYRSTPAKYSAYGDLKACIGLWRCWAGNVSFSRSWPITGRSGASCKLSPNQSAHPAVFQPGIRGSLAWRSAISPVCRWVDGCGSDHRTILGILWVIEEACMCLYHGSLDRAMVRPKRGSWICGSDMRSGGICRFIY